MDFKFDFLTNDGEKDNQFAKTVESETIEEQPVEELEFSSQSADNPKDGRLPNYSQVTLCNGSVIKYLTADAAHDIAGIGDHTDLVPGVYEGGWKTWECSYLLLDYLSEVYPSFDGNKNILELGCGSALPGLYCLLQGADVTFQDYNKNVIQEMTMPNARLTVSDNTELLKKCKFFSGDWKHFHDLMVTKQYKYDIILTSETIYNCNSYEKLHNIFSACIVENGQIYIACKYHYFGVGGGVESFKQYVLSEGVFHIETVSTTDENLQCCILRLSKKTTEHTAG